MSPIQGFVRLRKWQDGKQSAFGTAVTPKRVYPVRGSPEVNPNYEDPDVDVGHVDPVLPYYSTGLDLTATREGPLDYDSIPELFGASTVGGVSPTGATAKTWLHTAASDTVPARDYFTSQWGDDTSASDGFQFVDGIIENLTFTLPENLSPWTVSADWRWAKRSTYPTDRAVLSVGSNTNIWVFGADTELFINDTAAAFGTTKISDALRGATISINQTVDLKRYANGSNSRFEIMGYGFSGREVTASVTFEKTGQAIFDEVTDWLNTAAPDRFLEFRTTSPSIITGSTPYSWRFRVAGNWRTRSDGEIGGNTNLTLELRGKYQADFGTIFSSQVVNTLAAASL